MPHHDDASGLSDPYVKVTVHGKVRKTRVVKQVCNCVWDETLFFNLSGLTQQEAEEARVTCEVRGYGRLVGFGWSGSVWLVGWLVWLVGCLVPTVVGG